MWQQLLNPATLIFLTAFGLLVVVPITAIVMGNRQSGTKKTDQLAEKLMKQLSEVNDRLDNQQKQIDDLKELLHVNILKREDEETFRNRLNL